MGTGTLSSRPDSTKCLLNKPPDLSDSVCFQSNGSRSPCLVYLTGSIILIAAIYWALTMSQALS